VLGQMKSKAHNYGKIVANPQLFFTGRWLAYAGPARTIEISSETLTIAVGFFTEYGKWL
jgi:hypothetical protein